MSFFRPEAVVFLRNWGMPAVLAVTGGYAIVRGWHLVSIGAWTGWILMTLGLFACLALFGTIERAITSWRGRRGGPGIVTIEEGRISYYGPRPGGVMGVDTLVGIDIVTTDEGPFTDDLFWVLSDQWGQQVIIPGGAAGTDKLLDSLGGLKGFDHMTLMKAMSSTSNARFEIWRSEARSQA